MLSCQLPGHWLLWYAWNCRVVLPDPRFTSRSRIVAQDVRNNKCERCILCGDTACITGRFPTLICRSEAGLAHSLIYGDNELSQWWRKKVFGEFWLPRLAGGSWAKCVQDDLSGFVLFPLFFLSSLPWNADAESGRTFCSPVEGYRVGVFSFPDLVSFQIEITSLKSREDLSQMASIPIRQTACNFSFQFSSFFPYWVC
jgi:hypothetical protein